MVLELDEEERQQILLALAVLTWRSPGFDWYNRQIAIKLQGAEMYEGFKVSGKK